LRAIVCAEGDWQAVGQPLAVFSDEPSEALPASTDDLEMLVVEYEVS
jgi:hypothetical protein